MSLNNQTEHPQNFETSPNRQVDTRMGNTLSPIGVIRDDPAIVAESQTQQTLIQETNNPIPPSDGPSEELEEREVETQHITAKRQRFSYSKKLLHAPHSFWLNPSSYKSFKQQFPICKKQPIYLYGKIIECPNLQNSKQFTIAWNLCYSNFSDECVLRSFSLSLDTKNKLQQYIQDFLDSKQPPQPPICVINKDNSDDVNPANSCPIDQNDSAAHPLTHAATYNKNEGSASESNRSDDSLSQNSKQRKRPRILRQSSTAIGRRRSPRLRKQSHFKKWYKKTYLAIMDCMLLNSYISWNMSCKERHGKAIRRQELSRSEFITIVAQQMVTYRDPDNGNNETTEILSSTIHETTTQRNSG